MHYVRRSCVLRICSAELYEWEMSCCVLAGSYLTGTQTKEREIVLVAFYNHRCTWIREGGIFSNTSVSDGERGRKKRGEESTEGGVGERVTSTNKQLCSVDLNYSGLSTAENQKNSPTNNKLHHQAHWGGIDIECLVVKAGTWRIGN